MKVNNWLTTRIIFLFAIALTSCTNNGLKGKKLYLLVGNITVYGYGDLKEFEMNFFSSNKMQARMVLYANPYGYKILTDSSAENSSKIYSYEYKDGVLELSDFKVMDKLEFVEDGKIKRTEGGYFYSNSIVPLLGTPNADARLEEASKNRSLLPFFKKMIKKPFKPLIRIENGIINGNAQ